eukprot:gene7585-15545_t
MTFNIWGPNLWPERVQALSNSLVVLGDIILFQEMTPSLIDFLDIFLCNYKRVDDTSIPGWYTESNIYWRKDLFNAVEIGSAPLFIDEYPNRHLFWARLSFNSDPSKSVFVSTAHLPWTGCNAELLTGINQRIPTTNKICEILKILVKDNEVNIFAGDFNDDFHPIRILKDTMKFIDVFELCNLIPPITHPVRPSDPREETRPSRTIDWITCKLPVNCKVIGAFAKNNRGGSSFPPASDHLPIIAFIEVP